MDSPFPPGMMPCIEEFFSRDSSRCLGKLIYLEVFDTELFFPLQRMRELVRMMEKAKTIKPKVVFEIGADKGGGLYHWIKCQPTVEKVIACEIRGLPYKRLFEQNFPWIKFLWLESSSYDSDTVTTVQQWLGESKIDCLFIDGDKTKFLDDFDTYLPFMNSPSFVFLHDIQDREPRRAFAKIQEAGYDTSEILDTSEAEEAMVRAVRNIPPKNPYEAWLRHWKGTSCGVGCVFLP